MLSETRARRAATAAVHSGLASILYGERNKRGSSVGSVAAGSSTTGTFYEQPTEEKQAPTQGSSAVLRRRRPTGETYVAVLPSARDVVAVDIAITVWELGVPQAHVPATLRNIASALRHYASGKRDVRCGVDLVGKDDEILHQVVFNIDKLATAVTREVQRAGHHGTRSQLCTWAAEALDLAANEIQFVPDPLQRGKRRRLSGVLDSVPFGPGGMHFRLHEPGSGRVTELFPRDDARPRFAALVGSHVDLEAEVQTSLRGPEQLFARNPVIHSVHPAGLGPSDPRPVRAIGPATGRSLRGTAAWTSREKAQFRGKWVALEAGSPIDSDESFQALKSRVGTAPHSQVVFARVPSIDSV